METILEALVKLTKQATDEQKIMLEALIRQTKENDLSPAIEALILQNKKNSQDLLKKLEISEPQGGTTFMVKAIKGDKGETGPAPVVGKDYWTKSDQARVINEAKSGVRKMVDREVDKSAKKLSRQIDSVDRSIPMEGKDFLTPKEVQRVAEDQIVGAFKKKDVPFKAEIIKEVSKMLPELPEELSGNEIVDKVELLRDDERLSYTALKDTPDLSILGRNIAGVIQEMSTEIQPYCIQDEGIDLAKRTKLNFVGAAVTVTDDPANEATLVTITGGGTTITGTDTHILFFDGDDNPSGDIDLRWDKTNNRMTLGSTANLMRIWAPGEDNMVIGGGLAGDGLSTNGNFNVGLGQNTFQNGNPGDWNVAVGLNALVQTTGTGNVAIGPQSLTSLTDFTGDYNIGIGTSAGNLVPISGSQNIFIGRESTTGDPALVNQIAIGTSASTGGSNSVALGNSASTTDSGGVALGGSATADDDAVALGKNSSATGQNGLAIGPQSSASNTNTTGIGNGASTSGANSVAIGSFSSVTHANSVVLGLQAESTATNQFTVGSDGTGEITELRLGVNTDQDEGMVRYQQAIGLTLDEYGSGDIEGVVTKRLGVTAGGLVIEEDKAGFIPVCFVYESTGGQALVSQGGGNPQQTTVTMDTVSVNDTDYFTYDGTDTITVVQDGVYEIVALVKARLSTSGQRISEFGVIINIDGTSLAPSDSYMVHPQPFATSSAQTEWVATLTAGQTVSMDGIRSAGSAPFTVEAGARIIIKKIQ